MYRCASCKKVTEPREKFNKVVLETQRITYPVRFKAHILADGSRKDDPGGVGTRIVREVGICDSCFEAKVANQHNLYKESWD